jgi:recombination protein RecA
MANRRQMLDNVPQKPPERVSSLEWLGSGSYLLDKALGGGWPFGRIVNIVGDRSSGKSLLAIEALGNCARASSIRACRYAEGEAAFEESYAETLGYPAGLEPFDDLRTVEDFDKDLRQFIKGRNANSIYVLDSLDALSDDAEMKRDLGEATYGTAKARLLSETFRKIVKDVEAASTLLMIISQTREAIGVMFGEKKTRSGGKALDFYASQIVWLAEVQKLKRTVSRVERVIGVEVRARVKKNKVGLPFRECNFQIVFGYGIDDEASMIDWLVDNKTWDAGAAKEVGNDLFALRSKADRTGLQQLSAELREIVGERWDEIENALKPMIRKYE